MLVWLFLLFVILPIVELSILIEVGKAISVGPTIALVLLIGAIGAALARRQGLSALRRIQGELAAGRMPSAELSDGILILLAGVLMIMPGFLSDLVGILLLIPQTRALFRRAAGRYFRSRVQVMQVHTVGVRVNPDEAPNEVARFDYGPRPPAKFVASKSSTE